MLTGPGSRLGAREAFGTPAAVLAAGFVGYGALAADSGMSLVASVLSTLLIWALPGQLILVEMSSSSAAWAAILLAVGFSAVRFLPMTVSLLPVLRAARHGRAREYAAAHLIAMTGWVAAMRRAPELEEDERLPYLVGYSLTLWGASLVATAAGFLVADNFPPLAKAGFVFMNPVYFLLMLLGDARNRLTALSLAAGAICGPLVYLASPEWSVIAAGLVGGTAAYALHRLGARAKGTS